MRFRSVLFIAGAALIAAAGSAPLAHADGLLGKDDGVTATRSGDRLDVTFTPAALAAAKLKAGRSIEVECSIKPPPSPLAFSESEDDGEPRADGQGELGADGVAHVNLFASGPNQPNQQVAAIDVCEVSRVTRTSQNTSVTTPVASAALTPAGDVWVDESERATAMKKLLVGARTAHGYAPAARLGAGVVALGSPDATPVAGQIGYWTDGSHATVATASDAGRRLVMQDLGHGMLRSNVLDKVGDLGADTVGDSLSIGKRKNPENDPGDSPYKAGQPVLPKDGVRAAIGARRLTVRFTRDSAKALAAVAGRRVGASCFARPASSLFPVLVAGGGRSASGWTRVPRRGGRIAIPLSSAKADVCLVVDDGTLVAIATPTATGLRWWRDLHAVGLLLAVDLDHLGAAGGTTYRSTAAAVAHSDKGLVAMAGANGPAPVNRVGVWTDGAHRATVATRSASGRVITLADEGDGMVRANVFGELSNLWLLLALGGTATGGQVGTL